MSRTNISKQSDAPKKGKVLLIDDDASLRRVTEYSLQRAGYHVTTAEDGVSGLELFHEKGPDIVITDIQMPGLSGLDVLQAVKSEKPETVVIVMTAYGTVEIAVKAMKTGAYDYIAKPFSRDEVLMVVDRAFGMLNLQHENQRLRKELSQQVDFGHIVGTSDAMQEVFEVVRRTAPTDATVLISGDSGTGKELIAKALHQGSDRAAKPFVAVNCAALPRELLESELFGHVRGAFTGATVDRQGRFVQADGGTLFLDEIGELPLELQPKLLRVLQEREVVPLGGTARKVDVRLIAATNRNIEKALAEGFFREDLYYRLAVILVDLPPLCQRIEDIPLLVQHFLKRYTEGPPPKVSKSAMSLLCNYHWPGNIRELENTVQRMLILGRGHQLDIDDLPEKIRIDQADKYDNVLRIPDKGYPLEEIEKEAVLQALQRNRWNQTRAANFLQIPRHTLIYRMEKYGIQKPQDS